MTRLPESVAAVADSSLFFCLTATATASAIASEGCAREKRKYLRRFDGLAAPPAFWLEPGRLCIYLYVSHLSESRRSLLRSGFYSVHSLKSGYLWSAERGRKEPLVNAPLTSAGVWGFLGGKQSRIEAPITGKRFVNWQPATGFLIDITTHSPSNSFHVRMRIHQL